MLKSNLPLLGILYSDDFSQIWKSYKLTSQKRKLHLALLKILQHFETVYPFPPSSLACLPTPLPQNRGEVFLVPFLLPETPPPDLPLFLEGILKGITNGEGQRGVMGERGWGGERGWLPFGRLFKFDFLPEGFFGRLMVRILHWGVSLLYYWRCGMVFSLGVEIAVVTFSAKKIILEVF